MKLPIVKEQKIKLRDTSSKNKQRPIIERIRTFEDACDVLGLNKELFITISTNDEKINKYFKHLIAETKLMIIAEALNEGWIPNWEDGNERKWRPWFNLKAGFVFGYSNNDYWNADSGSGSRLCFETEAKSNYAAQQFIDLWKDYIMIEN